jgi:pimeloyl-ACP methyl ester carboxylesterase
MHDDYFLWQNYQVFYRHRASSAEMPILLFLHSFGVGASSEEYRANLLTVFASYRLDFLGWGRSDHPPLDYGSDLYTALVIDFIQQVIQKPVWVIASSIGAGIALQAVSRNPSSFQGVILIGPQGGNTISQANDAVKQGLNFLLDTPVGTLLQGLVTSPQGISLFVRNRLYSAAYPPLELDKEIARHRRNAHQPGAAYSLKPFLNGTLCTPILEDLWAVPSTMPILCLWGRDNLLNPIQNAQKFLSVRPDIPLVPLQGAFYPHIEDREAFENAVRDFIVSVGKDPTAFGTSPW